MVDQNEISRRFHSNIRLLIQFVDRHRGEWSTPSECLVGLTQFLEEQEPKLTKPRSPGDPLTAQSLLKSVQDFMIRFGVVPAAANRREELFNRGSDSISKQYLEHIDMARLLPEDHASSESSTTLSRPVCSSFSEQHTLILKLKLPPKISVASTAPTVSSHQDAAAMPHVPSQDTVISSQDMSNSAGKSSALQREVEQLTWDLPKGMRNHASTSNRRKTNGPVLEPASVHKLKSNTIANAPRAVSSVSMARRLRAAANTNNKTSVPQNDILGHRPSSEPLTRIKKHARLAILKPAQSVRGQRPNIDRASPTEEQSPVDEQLQQEATGSAARLVHSKHVGQFLSGVSVGDRKIGEHLENMSNDTRSALQSLFDGMEIDKYRTAALALIWTPSQSLCELYVAIFGFDWKSAVSDLLSHGHLTSFNMISALVSAAVHLWVLSNPLRHTRRSTISFPSPFHEEEFASQFKKIGGFDFRLLLGRVDLETTRLDGYRALIAQDALALAGDMSFILMETVRRLAPEATGSRVELHQLTASLVSVFEHALLLRAELDVGHGQWSSIWFSSRTKFDSEQMRERFQKDGKRQVAMTLVPGIKLTTKAEKDIVSSFAEVITWQRLESSSILPTDDATEIP